MSSVRAVPRLGGGKSTGGCRRSRPRCAGVTTPGGVGAMTRGVESCETSIGLVPEVALRPYCKTHHTLLQRRLRAK